VTARLALMAVPAREPEERVAAGVAPAASPRRDPLDGDRSPDTGTPHDLGGDQTVRRVVHDRPRHRADRGG